MDHGKARERQRLSLLFPALRTVVKNSRLSQKIQEELYESLKPWPDFVALVLASSRPTWARKEVSFAFMSATRGPSKFLEIPSPVPLYNDDISRKCSIDRDDPPALVISSSFYIIQIARHFPPCLKTKTNVYKWCQTKQQIALVRMPRRNIVAQTRPNDYNNMQHSQMLRKNFWPFSKLSLKLPTCRNGVVKRVQHFALNNVGICCVECWIVWPEL